MIRETDLWKKGQIYLAHTGQMGESMLDISPRLVEGEQPLYMQLYHYFREEIQTGKLPSATRLPSVRALSRFLQVSKTTVESAYHQLMAEGYIESRDRSGYYVVELEADLLPPEKRAVASGTSPNAVKRIPIRYDFHQARVDADHFPFELWRKYTNQCMRRENPGILHYGDRQGEPELREQIAAYLRRARGVNCTPEQIVIAAGTQLIISLLCQMLAENGRSVAMEEPGYNGVRTVMQHMGLSVEPIPLEEDGIDVNALAESGARVVYITPSHQDPSGIVMPYAKRMKLLQWAANAERLIIEDDYDGEFRYHGKPIPSLQGLDKNGRVVYLGTFSKSLLPAIRVSYMVLPPALLQVYRERFLDYDQTVSTIHQQTLALFMKNGEWERHIRKMRTIYQKKHDAMLSVLETVMGNHVRIMGQDAGLSITLEVASERSAVELAELAEQAGIRVYPTTVKWMKPDQMRCPAFQFGFGGLSIEDIEQGIRLLYQVWRQHLRDFGEGTVGCTSSQKNRQEGES
jgi:GntR family transcriptional regulator/MocR family aminotransferase